MRLDVYVTYLPGFCLRVADCAAACIVLFG